MTKKFTASSRTALDREEHLRRIQRAREESKFKQGLELARELFRFEPNDANRDLLKEMSLGRAHQLYSQGGTGDALTLLQAAHAIDPENPAWLTRLVQLMASYGGIRQAIALSNRLSPGVENPQILAHVADFSIAEPAGNLLDHLGSWNADHDRILLAFRQMQEGKDEQSLATLQVVGLRSPFLEWKLLIRGFISYYQGDDLKALENWQRLNPDRVPARLAAPFRVLIDVAYHNAQKSETIKVLTRQRERLQPASLLPQLRAVRQALVGEPNMQRLFKDIQAFLPSFQLRHPNLVHRLATILYWALLQTGPKDFAAYIRVFGKPPDDPEFHRLSAIAYEKVNDLEEAHRWWEEYEKGMAHLTQGWSSQELVRARALILLRMGKNAASIPSAKETKNLSPMFRDMFMGGGGPLKPSAEECLKRCLKLAPDLREAHELLLKYQIREGKNSQAINTAKKLLEHQPSNTWAHLSLAQLYVQQHDPTQALEILQKAIRIDPLDRELRSRLCYVHLLIARDLMNGGQYEDALQQYQDALKLESDKDLSHIQAKIAACLVKSGHPEQAEELIEKAKRESSTPITVGLQFLIEISRANLDRKSKKTALEKEFKASLATPPVAVEAIALLRVLFEHHMAEINYAGQKGHVKLVYSYLNEARIKVGFNAGQYRSICEYLQEMGAPERMRNQFLKEGLRYPESAPYCLFYQAQALMYKKRSTYSHTVQALQLLNEASQKVQNLPPGPDAEKLIHNIETMKGLLRDLNPFGGGLFGFDDDDEDYDEDDL